MRRIALPAVLLVAAFAATPAFGSAIVGRNVTRATLTVDRHGHAHVGYSAGGRRTTLVAWGAINARTPNRTVPQVKFQLRYGEGGRGVCLPYDGPPLAWLVKGCKAPDGSYWALQEWVRLAPMRGLPPFKSEQTARELHVSHWTGPLPLLQVWPNWTYGGRWQGFFGRLTYRGAPVYGSQSSSFGQYVFIDTHNSIYGRGWKHDAGKALHRRNGAFCYSFVPQYPPSDYPTHKVRGPGLGDRHRVSVVGPGVTPIVSWEGPRLGPYDPVADAKINALFDRIMAGDRVCAKER